MYLVKMDAANSKRSTKTINENDLSVDSLSISDYDFFLNKSILILFIFDEFQNSMFNLKIDIDSMKTEVINNVYVSLDSLDFTHHKMNCWNEKSDEEI